MDNFRATICEMDYEELVSLRKWCKHQLGSSNKEGREYCATLLDAINDIIYEWQ